MEAPLTGFVSWSTTRPRSIIPFFSATRSGFISGSIFKSLRYGANPVASTRRDPSPGSRARKRNRPSPAIANVF